MYLFLQTSTNAKRRISATRHVTTTMGGIRVPVRPVTSSARILSPVKVCGPCTLKRNCRHFNEIFVKGCSESCQNKNF